ncbi:MAG: hypothetical protein HIU86_08220 [Acidobacteria bacterium]|nr:hypothetical protein [Acidobacteriota bacterium]
MTTTTTARAADLHVHELPALTTADRAALAIGTRLILRAEQHRVRRAERAARTEQARAAHAAAQAELGRQRTAEHRALAGPRW